ncbi:MAG: hypothetical protein Q9188_007026, partial [Gyalolechia gomerana]
QWQDLQPILQTDDLGILINRALSSQSSNSTGCLSVIDDENPQIQRFLGAGTCGTVFQWIDKRYVLKYSDDPPMLAPRAQPWNEYGWHKTTNEGLDSVQQRGLGPVSFKVPQCYTLVPKTQKNWWDDHMHRFPERYQKPGHLLIPERIFSVPRSARHAIIDRYFPVSERRSAKKSPENEDAVIRLYLGKRNAITLHVWALDFNQCQPLSMDEMGVNRAIKSYVANDPYFPKPPVRAHGQSEELVWSVFEKRYLELTTRVIKELIREPGPDGIMPGYALKLPELFIKGIIDEWMRGVEKMRIAEERSAETHFHYIRCSRCNRFVREINGEWATHWENCPGPYKDTEENDPHCTAGSKERIDVKQPKKDRAKPYEKPKAKPKEKGLPASIPDFYGYLKVDPSSTQADIVQAARKRRVEVHPDKLKKPGMSDEELEKIDQVAMQVGWAADVLLDLEKRAKYDRKLADYFSMRK